MRRSVSTRRSDDSRDKPTTVREGILDATLALLQESGYESTTTDAIAARARVSKATIYRLWQTKQDVVVEAARQRFQKLTVPDLGSFEDEVIWVLDRRLDDYRKPGVLRLVAALVGAQTSDPRLNEVFEEWVEQFSLTLRSIIQRGIARGDVDIAVDVYALETLISGVIARSVVVQRPFPPNIVEHLAALLSTAARA